MIYVKKISKNRTNQSNKVYVSSGSILKWIVQKEGYSNLFSRLIYIYLLKSNDPDHKVYRIDETDLWDQLITVKREIVDNDICTNTQQQLIKDISGNLVDAALFSDVRLLDDSHNNYPALTDEYVILPLYESYKLNSEFYYFTVSKQCEEKQLAVQYIDWLLSNDEARKLIVYGIEGVNYKFDKNTRMIYTDDEVSSMSLAFIGTGTNMMTKGYSILGDISDASYIKDKLLKSFTPSWDVARITQIRNLKEYAEVINEFFNNKNNADKIFNEYNLSRFPSLEMQKIRSDLVMYSFFDEDITIEFLNEFYEKIKDAHDTAINR